MKVFRPFSIALFALLLLLPLAVCGAQEKVIKGKVTDTQNYQYNLTGLTVSGISVFHLKILDTEFRLAIEKVRSLAVVPETESPYKGYVLADVAIVDGAVSRAWVDFENYWIQGVDENLGVVLKIKMTEVIRLDLTAETPAPAPEPSSLLPL